MFLILPQCIFLVCLGRLEGRFVRLLLFCFKEEINNNISKTKGDDALILGFGGVKLCRRGEYRVVWWGVWCFSDHPSFFPYKIRFHLHRISRKTEVSFNQIFPLYPKNSRGNLINLFFI